LFRAAQVYSKQKVSFCKHKDHFFGKLFKL